MQRAARLANGLQPLAVRMRHAAHHTPATGGALLQRTELRCKRCNRLQQHCGRLQRIALRCNRLRCWSVAADRTVLQSSLQQVATGCGLLQRPVVYCNGPWSIATGCGLLSADRTVLQSSLQQVATGCGLLQLAAVCCNGLHCSAIAATGCNGLWPMAANCGLLQQVVLRSIGPDLLRHTRYCEHRCNRLQRAVVGRNGSHGIAIAATGCNGL